MKITVTMTASEILEKGLWEKYCELTGTNEWALNEGLMDEDEELVLPDQLADRFIKERAEQLEEED